MSRPFKFFCLVSLVAVSSFWAGGWSYSATETDDPTNETAKAMLEAARDAYASAMNFHHVGKRADDQNIHAWSFRWMQAELAVNQSLEAHAKALIAHLQRMEQMHQLNAAKRAQGILSAMEHLASAYYVAEAKHLIAEANRDAQ